MYRIAGGTAERAPHRAQVAAADPPGDVMLPVRPVDVLGAALPPAEVALERPRVLCPVDHVAVHSHIHYIHCTRSHGDSVRRIFQKQVGTDSCKG